MTVLDDRRHECLTGTDMTILMGAVPAKWGTPRSVYLHKKRLAPPSENSIRMDLGNELEDYVCKLWSKETGLNPIGGEFVHAPMLNLGGTPDRMIPSTHQGMEIKTTVNESGWGPSMSDEIPDRVRIQIHVYMIVTGCREWHVAVLFLHTAEFRRYIIKYDAALAGRIIEVADHFWTTYVEPSVLPDDRAVAEDQILSLYPADDGSVVEADEDIAIAISMAHSIREDIKRSEEKKKEIDEKIKSFMGAHKTATTPGYRATWSTVSPQAKTDWESIARVLMEKADPTLKDNLLGAYTTLGAPSRRFTITKKG